MFARFGGDDGAGDAPDSVMLTNGCSAVSPVRLQVVVRGSQRAAWTGMGVAPSCARTDDDETPEGRSAPLQVHETDLAGARVGVDVAIGVAVGAAVGGEPGELPAPEHAANRDVAIIATRIDLCTLFPPVF
jgi:hypothetical protein